MKRKGVDESDDKQKSADEVTQGGISNRKPRSIVRSRKLGNYVLPDLPFTGKEDEVDSYGHGGSSSDATQLSEKETGLSIQDTAASEYEATSAVAEIKIPTREYFSEAEAVLKTKSGDETLPLRIINNFSVIDENAVKKAIDDKTVPLFLCGIIFPENADLLGASNLGVRCGEIFPIQFWSISGYDKGKAVVSITTEIATYKCGKPTPKYENFYKVFYHKARLCVEVHKALEKSRLGSSVALDELLTIVANSISGPGGSNEYSKQLILSHGKFIYMQLTMLDDIAETESVPFGTLPVLLELRTQAEILESYSDLNMDVSSALTNILSEFSVRLDDVVLTDAPSSSTGDFMEAKFQEVPCSTSMPHENKIYIKISEDEIANDYPLPGYYEPKFMEIEERTLAYIKISTIDHFILEDWSLYDSDLRLISLELLPMQPCCEVDIAIYFSANLKGYDDRFCSSPILEWKLDIQRREVFIRTYKSWYKLQAPSNEYFHWYNPFMRCVTLAKYIILMLEVDNFKLSFSSVCKRLSGADNDHPAHISSDVLEIERYVVVHGQILLHYFTKHPEKKIGECAFFTDLIEKMSQRNHRKLLIGKNINLSKEANHSPITTMVSAQQGQEPSTGLAVTRLINSIWVEHIIKFYSESCKRILEFNLKKDKLEEYDVIERWEKKVRDGHCFAEEQFLAPNSLDHPVEPRFVSGTVKWNGDPSGQMPSSDTKLYREASINGNIISVGRAVQVAVNKFKDMIAIVEYMFEKSDGTRMFHGRVLMRSCHTILGNAGDERELFLTHKCVDSELKDIKHTTHVDVGMIKFGPHYNKENFRTMELDKEKADERRKKGLPTEYYCKALFCPDRRAFFSLPANGLALGTGECQSCLERELECFNIDPSLSSFVFRATRYHVNDFVYINPSHCGQIGPKPYVIGHMLKIEVSETCSLVEPESTMITVRRFYRPEDISDKTAYHSDVREIYYSEHVLVVPVSAISGKCKVGKKSHLNDLGLPVIVDHTFFCEYSHDPLSRSLEKLPCQIDFYSKDLVMGAKKYRNEKSKEPYLATLDIFSGCGAMTEGLQRSGVSCTRWAVETDVAAGKTLSYNHNIKILEDDSAVLLGAIMKAHGDSEDCIFPGTGQFTAASKCRTEMLPSPGTVDLIAGGLCSQESSLGSKKIDENYWDGIQRSKVLTFLSFADYFRPKFLLFRNSRDFMYSNNCSTFRLTLASLLHMGYQVRYGLLNSAVYGIPQPQKNTFIWAAAPFKKLPDWPEPMHVNAWDRVGAPFRPITVKDSIADLNPVVNGDIVTPIACKNEPVSWFQKQVRSSMQQLHDHVPKRLNELNLRRCRQIPHHSRANWKDIPNVKVKLENGLVVDLKPWHLPNWENEDSSEWEEFFGRLGWDSSFPTSIDDPRTTGKIRRCFHPDQDRIVTVRECARAKGFHDDYRFHGSIEEKYRQIASAVPPPLAYLLGRKLKEALDLP